MGSLPLLQRIFPTQGSDPGLLHCRWSLYQLSHKRSLRILESEPVPSSADLPNPGLNQGLLHSRLILYQLSYQRSSAIIINHFSSVTQSCPTLCDPMNRSMPGLPICHQLPEFTQTHVHQVSDAIQPSHPLSSPSPPAPNPSQHQSLLQ